MQNLNQLQSIYKLVFSGKYRSGTSIRPRLLRSYVRYLHSTYLWEIRACPKKLVWQALRIRLFCFYYITLHNFSMCYYVKWKRWLSYLHYLSIEMINIGVSRYFWLFTYILQYQQCLVTLSHLQTAEIPVHCPVNGEEILSFVVSAQINPSFMWRWIGSHGDKRIK